ncbi:MAG TPA: SRPBCC family protein [Longimicrobium sp.]|jgi:uncharacterized protein YndB with AHSA1/START domain
MTVEAQQIQEAPTSDRIEKVVVIRGTRSRVWRAITSAEEFGTWFRMKLDGEFAEGATVHGKVTHPGMEHVCPVEIQVERIEAERYFSYRWHPYPMDPSIDYSAEPTTLVEFTLEDAEGGVAVTISESGFDGIPLSRRGEAFRMNDRGWGGQIRNLTAYVE